MANRISLISDDSDFFEFIKLKLELRKSDKLFSFKFDDVPDKINFLETSVVIINSEGAQQKTLDLLNILNGTPAIVMSYNDDENFKKKCYRAGMTDFILLLTSDSEFRARMIPALTTASILEKNRQYRQILVKNKIVSINNEVFLDYEKIIDNVLEELKLSHRNIVFGAISADDKNKFLIKSSQIESIIINNIRKNDILINYAPTKYYIILYDTVAISAKKIWENIAKKFQHKIYAGFVDIKNQNRQQLINLALNRLSEEINSDNLEINKINNLNQAYPNFKQFRKEFSQKLEQIITPAFYTTQQKYSHKLVGIQIKSNYNNNLGFFNITSKHINGYFKITSPGFSKILIDIIIKKDNEVIDDKRIPFETEELESGLLEDLLEQFITETVKYINRL